MGIELLRRRSIPFLGFRFWGLKFMRARAFPPTYAFRNKKFWVMFMEANRLG